AFGRVRPELSWWLPSWVRIASGGADRSQSQAAGRRARSLTGISINALWRADNERRGQEMKTSILARLVAAGTMLAAAAGAAPAQALKPWKHGIIAPKADAGFLLGGQARLCGTRGPQARIARSQRRPLLAGELDSYEGGPQSAIAVGVRGGDVKIMGCHWVVVPHGIMVKPGIDKMADVKGKSIAVSAPGSFPDMLARVAPAKFNIAPSDVTLAAVGGDRDRYTALVGGVVDAAVVSNEYLPLAWSKNLKMLLEGREALPNFLRICMFSSGKVLAQRRDDAIRYLSG